MTIILDHWRIRWLSIAFQPETGCGRVRWFTRKTNTCNGWASKHKRVWYALWNSDSGLIFQAGSNKWNLNNCQCLNENNGERRFFKISENGKTLFKLRYKAPHHTNDISMDQLDLETTDFFYWVSLVCNDSNLKNQIIASWQVFSID